MIHKKLTIIGLALLLISSCSNSLKLDRSTQRVTQIENRWIKVNSGGKSIPADSRSWSCVNDAKTGLQWEVKTKLAGLHDANNTYTWAEAGKGYVRKVNAGKLCGHNDWRLPTTSELLTIVKCPNNKPATKESFGCHQLKDYPYALINKSIFPYAKAKKGYWTSSYTKGEPVAEMVIFSRGSDHFGFLDVPFYTRLVRSWR